MMTRSVSVKSRKSGSSGGGALLSSSGDGPAVAVTICNHWS